MGDRELVSSAQRAAAELERAWARWRHARGLIDGVSEPVASYVAHSADHPWGRPRVVLGLDVEEARALTALLGAEGREAEPGGAEGRRADPGGTEGRM